MTPDIQAIIEEATDRGCDYCDFITLMLDDISCCEYCPFDIENVNKCILTTMRDILV